MRIGIVGAGSIGCYVGGSLLAANAADVVFVGRPRVRDELAAHGLTVQTLGRSPTRVPPERVVVAIEPGVLASCDATLVCVKSGQTAEVAGELAGVLGDGALVVSLQNGVRNAEVLRAGLPRQTCLAGIVGFNALSAGEGRFHRTTHGVLMIEDADSRVAALVAALAAAGLPVEARTDIVAQQWTKLLVNLSNAIGALTDVPTAQLVQSPAHRHLIADVVAEALGVVRAAGITPARFNGIPLRWMPRMLRLPTPLVKLIARRQVKIDPAARPSMWEDLERRRTTEVEYLNGEIVRLAAKVGVAAPLNRRLVELVHAAETAGTGTPRLGIETLRGPGA